MAENTNDPIAEVAVTEVAPSQKKHAGRPKGVKNGEGKTASKPASQKFHAEGVAVAGGALRVTLAEGVTLRYAPDNGAVTLDCGAAVLTADQVAHLYKVANSIPAAPSEAGQVSDFCSRLGITEIPFMSTVYNWVVA